METVFAGTKSTRPGDDERFQVLALQELVGSVCFQEGTEGVSISFRYVAIMSSVQRNGMAFDVVTTGLVRQIL